MRPRRVPIARLEAGDLRVEGAAAHYLARVLRLETGDTFVAFDPATGNEANATTLEVRGDAVTVHVGPLREGKARAPFRLTFIQGLAKGDKCDAVVRDATELGITRFIVAETMRSVVRLDTQRRGPRQTRWARIAEQAARQSGRSDTPTVDVPADWPSALERVDESDARFCLWEGATEPLAPPLYVALAEGQALAFACGAEGGLEPSEVAFARDRGWKVVSLGPSILRTETVAAAVLGAVRVWRGLFP